MDGEARRSNYDLQVDLTRTLFLSYDQAALIRKFQLEADEGFIYIDYLGESMRVCRSSGRVDARGEAGQWRECRDYNAVMTIYDLLCHSQGEHPPALAGEWCPIGSFVVTASHDTGRFTNAYAARFQGRVDALKAACARHGGRIQPSVAGADLSCIFDVTRFFPLMLQFWDADDEFPAQLRLLWDRNTLRFLHYETSFFLQNNLLERLAADASAD